MPGYEIERFPNLSANEKSEYTCSICQDIFCCPMTAQCCLQTFCEECITNWLKNNTTCPYDRKTLTPKDLSRPPRVLMNMLGKLKIRCDFKDKGCKEVVNLEDLTQHAVKCKYNVETKVKKCKKCFCEQKSGHDCIKSLLELNRKANEEINALKRNPLPTSPPIRQPAPAPPPVAAVPARPVSLFNTSSTGSSIANSLREQSLIREINELKTEKMNFLKTIQDLSNSPVIRPTSAVSATNNQRLSQSDPKPPITSSPEISEQEIFNSCRKHLWTPEVLQNEMNKDVTQKLMTIVRAQVKEYNSIFVVCKNIVEKLNEEFGHRWHCMADYKSGSKSFFTYEEGFLIKVKFGLLVFEIHKTQFFNAQSLKHRFKNGKIKREIQILRTDMKQSMISDVKKITFAAIEKSDTLAAISTEIKTQMEKRYPEHMWQCFIHCYFGVFRIHHTCGTFISFEVGGQLTVTLFQSNTS